MPYGSPSSRFPRNPMCPFESAKIDSLDASWSVGSSRSRTAQGSIV